MVIDETTAPSHASSEYAKVMLEAANQPDESRRLHDLEQIAELIKWREAKSWVACG